MAKYDRDTKTISINRGDSATLSITANMGSEPFTFLNGDVIYFKVTEKKVLLSETRKTETTYAFANSFYRFSMKIPGRSSKWISTKRLRDFVLAADTSKAKDYRLKRAMTGVETVPFAVYESEEYAMEQMFSEIFYIKKILDDMNKDKQFRNMDYPKEIDE